MCSCYSGTATALRDALRHAVERGGAPSLGVLHQDVPSASTLTETDAMTQTARVRRQLDRLAPLERALPGSVAGEISATAVLRAPR